MSSVVICAYTMDRWDLLSRAVESAASQTDDTEVIIVIDHNDELLARALDAWPQHRVVPNAGEQGLSGARNTGVDESTADIVAFLDDDAEAEPGWLAALADELDQPDIGGAGGPVVARWLADKPAWFPPEFGWVVGCSYTGQSAAAGPIRNPIGANMAFRRRVFEQVGGFREEIGRIGSLPLGCEETELSIRARSIGYEVMFRPDAVVHHAVPAERGAARYFVRRCFAEGMSKAVVSAMVGHDSGLSSERAYVGQALPAGLRRELGSALRGPRRADALRSAGAIALGVLAAAAGFGRGSVALRRNGVALQPAPAVRPRATASG